MGIFDRTHFQTGSSIKGILKGAQELGELHLLYWYIEMKSRVETVTGKRKRVRVEIRAACWPDQWIPVIAVTEDPDVTIIYANLLLELFKEANPGVEFGLTLTNRDLIEKYSRIYTWGDPCWDLICDMCGCVEASTLPHIKTCEQCRMKALIANRMKADAERGL